MSTPFSPFPTQFDTLLPTAADNVATRVAKLEARLGASDTPDSFLPLSGGTLSGNLVVGSEAAAFSSVRLTVQDSTSVTFLLVNNVLAPSGSAGAGGAASLILRSTTAAPYGWRVTSEGTADRLSIMDEGVGTRFWIPGQANAALGIGSPTGTGAILTVPSQGLLTLTDATAAAFTRLQFGGTDSTYPALGRNGVILEVLAADGAATASLAVYNTKTSTTSYERLDASWSADVARLWTSKGSGGGSARALVLGADGTELLRFGSSTTLSFFGVAAVARQLVPTGSSTDTVITALQNLGLFRQS